jgi:glycosyltransferase involved in cell wall biosynthesis
MPEQTVPITVAVPTIGRSTVLEQCIQSVIACDPRPDEILLVDQSGDARVRELVDRHAEAGVHLLFSDRRSRALARNLALEQARHDTVAFTDDDCTVETDWANAAWSHAVQAQTTTAVTGRVLPVGDDPLAVPSTIDAPERRDYTGMRLTAALFGNNMVLDRMAALALGGFDHRVIPAEDNDFSYRWLAAGHTIRYEPDLVVHHHDWRSHDELERLYVEYARGQGAFYGKHLRQGDRTMVRFITGHFYRALRGYAARVVKGRPRWSDERQSVFHGMPRGLVHGWRAGGKSASAEWPDEGD